MGNPRAFAVEEEIVKILLVSSLEDDRRALRQILHHSKWQQYDAGSEHEALAFLEDNPIPVVICDSDLPDGSWRHLLSRLAETQCPPMLVVTSRLADEVLWAEVLNLGAYNVLAKPFEKSEVFHVVSFASSAWKSQWERPKVYARSA
jgi:DNA-binding response OmpR family regulator